MITNLKIIDQATSSSDLAKDAVLKNKRKYGAFFVKQQTKGRGRNSKDWFSPKGNLHLSIVVYPKTSLSNWNEFSIISALATRRSLMCFSGKFKNELKFKWPNDIIILNQKIGGILIETIPFKNSLIIGIGLNLLNSPPKLKQSWPVENLKNLYNIEVNPVELSNLIIKNLNLLIVEWENGLFTNIFEEWKKNLCYIGEYLYSMDFEKNFSGYFHNVGIKGQMVLKTDSNEFIEFFSGTFVPRFMLDKYALGN